MAIINTIKQKILELDQGTFQNLCDQILYSLGYSNFVSLGSQSGTQKRLQELLTRIVSMRITNMFLLNIQHSKQDFVKRLLMIFKNA